MATTRFKYLLWPQMGCFILGNFLIIGSFTLLFQVNIGGILGTVTYCLWFLGHSHFLLVRYYEQPLTASEILGTVIYCRWYIGYIHLLKVVF